MANDLNWTVVTNDLTGAIQGQIRRQSLEAVKETMDEILTDVRRRMHIPGRGRIYVHGGITHQASAPGQAPAAEAGDLWASYEVGVAMTADGPVGIIHSDSPYASVQEYGDYRQAPRPALTPAGEAARKTIVSFLTARLAKAA